MLKTHDILELQNTSKTRDNMPLSDSFLKTVCCNF